MDGRGRQRDQFTQHGVCFQSAEWHRGGLLHYPNKRVVLAHARLGLPKPQLSDLQPPRLRPHLLLFNPQVESPPTDLRKALTLDE